MTGHDAEDDRRRHARADLSAQVRWMDGERAMHGEAHDVSARGLSFVTERGMRKGAVVEVVIELPRGYLPLGPSPFAAKGRVTRSEPTEGNRVIVAMEFVDLGDAEEEALAKYVRRRSLVARSL